MKNTFRFFVFATLLLFATVGLATNAIAQCTTGFQTISSNLTGFNSPVFTAGGNCTLDISASLTGDSFGSGLVAATPAFLAQNDAIVSFNTGVISADGSGVDTSAFRAGARLLDNSVFTINGGSVIGEGSSSSVNRAGILAEDNASVTLNSGLISVQGSGVDYTAARAGVRLQGSSTFTMFGGSVTEQSVFGSTGRVGVLTEDSASAFLYGGSLSVGGVGGGVTTDIIAEDNSTIEIFGTGFNFADGDLQPLNGQLTGVLSDGTPLDWQFSRDPDARIIITNSIPEPSSALLLCTALISTLSLRRRRPA